MGSLIGIMNLLNKEGSLGPMPVASVSWLLKVPNSRSHKMTAQP